MHASRQSSRRVTTGRVCEQSTWRVCLAYAIRVVIAPFARVRITRKTWGAKLTLQSSRKSLEHFTVESFSVGVSLTLSLASTGPTCVMLAGNLVE